MRHVIAIDQGTTGTTVLVLDEQLAAARPRLPGVPPDLPAAGLGRARSRGDLGIGAPTRSARRCAGQSSRRRSRPSASRTSARPRCCGTADRQAPCTARSSGRTAAPRIAAPSSRPRPRSARRASHRPRARPVLLGHQAQLDARQRPGAARARARPASSRSAPSTATSCGGSPAARCTRPTSPTRRARCCSTSQTLAWDDELLELLGVPRALLPKVVAVVGTVRHDARACPACPTASRSRASPATSRRRCSARPASRPATRSAPTAPARSS